MAEELNVKEIKDVDVVYLNDNTHLLIGGSYQADIFYQYRQRIPDNWYVLLYEKHEFVLKEMSGKDKKRIIRYGEQIEIEGLWMMYLGNVLLLFSRKGDLRIAYRNRRTL